MRRKVQKLGDEFEQARLSPVWCNVFLIEWLLALRLLLVSLSPFYLLLSYGCWLSDCLFFYFLLSGASLPLNICLNIWDRAFGNLTWALVWLFRLLVTTSLFLMINLVLICFPLAFSRPLLALWGELILDLASRCWRSCVPLCS